METYHVPRTHPHITAFANDLSSDYDMFGLHGRMLNLTGVPSLCGGGEFTEDEVFQQCVAFNEIRVQVDGDAEPVDATDATTFGLPDGMTARQFMAEGLRVRAKSVGIDIDRVSDAELVDGCGYMLFPNVHVFGANPASVLVYRFRPNGDDQNSCIFDAMSLQAVPPEKDLPPDAPMLMMKPGERFADYEHIIGGFWLLDQDMSNCVLIQKGLRNLRRTVLAHRQELNVAAFHQNLDSFMSGR
jgi:hypothetical protein